MTENAILRAAFADESAARVSAHASRAIGWWPRAARAGTRVRGARDPDPVRAPVRAAHAEELALRDAGQPAQHPRPAVGDADHRRRRDARARRGRHRPLRRLDLRARGSRDGAGRPAPLGHAGDRARRSAPAWPSASPTAWSSPCLRINALIATLAAAFIVGGLANLIAKGNLLVLYDSEGNIKQGFARVAEHRLARGQDLDLDHGRGRSSCSVSCSRRPRPGRYMYAAGGNAEAARLAGVRVELRSACSRSRLSGTAAGARGR